MIKIITLIIVAIISSTNTTMKQHYIFAKNIWFDLTYEYSIILHNHMKLVLNICNFSYLTSKLIKLGKDTYNQWSIKCKYLVKTRVLATANRGVWINLIVFLNLPLYIRWICHWKNILFAMTSGSYWWRIQQSKSCTI